MTCKTKLLLQIKMAKKMHLILRCFLLQTESNFGALRCYNQAVAHPTWCQALPRLARKQFGPQSNPVPMVSNEVASKQSATNVCCRTGKDRPQGLENDHAIHHKSLYESMPRQIKAVVDVIGGHT